MLPFTLSKFNEPLAAIANITEDYEKCMDATDAQTFYVVLGGIRADHMPEDIKFIKQFLSARRGIYIVSGDDLLHIKNNYTDPTKLEDLLWIEQQHIAATITFTNQNIFSFVYGGIASDAKSWAQLIESFDPATTSMIKSGDGSSRAWHHSYNGRFGYVCSYNIPSDRVRIFTHSVSIGTIDHKTVIVTFNPNGIEKILNIP